MDIRYLLEQAPTFIIFIVGLLTIVFFFVSLKKYFRLRASLKQLNSELKSYADRNTNIDPSNITKFFEKTDLDHIWSEYTETLHAMRTGYGQNQIIEYRSGVQAEVMFTKEAIVESPLFDDFWRHLPGILTGLGIIGTFSGLLTGLGRFDAKNPTNTLEPLLESVRHAFSVSALAILAAMLVVFFSRFIIADLKSLVDQLCERIDSFYKAGAGEEYLQRLVESAEKAEANTAQLKDALVEDLTRLMTNLTERQIEAQRDASNRIGEMVGRSIGEAISEPMQRVREVLEQTTTGNGQMVDTMLTGFMAKLEDIFGSQISGINEQIQHSMASMSAVQSSMQELVNGIKTANETAADQMAEKMASAMQTASENQQQLTLQMTQFVQDFRTLLSEEQRKSKDVMDSTVANLLSEVSKAIASMEESRKVASNEDAERTRALTNQTGNMVAGLTSGMDELLKTVTEQVNKTQESINSIKDVTLRAIEGMNQGALTMSSAAQKFETAGGAVTKSFNESSSLIEKINSVASGLQSAAQAVNAGFDKYDATRRTVDAHVLALNGLIETAKKEAGISQQLIQNVEQSVKALRTAEAESRKNLESVNEQLVSAFRTFGDSLVKQVERVIGETDKNISTLSAQLTGVVQNIAQFMQQMRKQ